MKAHIAHVIPTDRIAYLMLRAQLQRVQEAGYDVSIICGQTDYGHHLADAGLRVIHIPFAREIQPLTDLRCMHALFHTLRREKCDIVHSHNPKGTLIVPFIGQCARMPIVTHTVHGHLFNENSRGLHRLLAVGAERWCATWCHHLLFQSQEDYEYALTNHFKKPDRLHLIGNGIDERRFDKEQYRHARITKRRELGLDETHLVVGMVARLVKEKGYLEFFEMAKRIASKMPQVRFLIVGISEPQEQSDAVDAQAIIAANRLTQNCILLDKRSDMPELYTCMDVAVLPSYREGIPRALLEAGAMGVPMIASDIRGCREVIQHGHTGLLFPLKDIAQLTRAVEHLLTNPEERCRLGQAGRQRVLSHYTEERTAQRLIACYESFLKNRRN